MTRTRALSSLSVAVSSALMVAACNGTISPGDGDDSVEVGGAGGSEAARGGSSAGSAGARGGAGGTTSSGGSSGNAGIAGRGGSSGSGNGGSSGSGSGGSTGGSGGSSAAAGSGSGSAGSAGTSSGEPAALAGILAAHNAVRAAKGIAPLTWDPALAAIAQTWVAQCVDNDGGGLVDHNAGRSEGYPTYVGENIYGSSGTASGTGAVSSWAGEEANYDYASNTCASGKVCGHYTQIVWANTTKLGCAIHRCERLRYASSVVCNYAPGGNIRGQKPY